ncbi:hypothetical protein N9931_00260 [bacterium]|nr:hypothetical protein [bacterium]
MSPDLNRSKTKKSDCDQSEQKEKRKRRNEREATGPGTVVPWLDGTHFPLHSFLLINTSYLHDIQGEVYERRLP